MDKTLEALLKHRCYFCKNPLSVPPVMTASTCEEFYKCGRCEKIMYKSAAQQSISSTFCFSSTKAFGIPNTVPVPIPTKIAFYRVSLYEDLARHYYFPCCYGQCNKKILWERVEVHERRCPHRTTYCPLFDTGCSKVTKISELVQHFEETHADWVKKMGMTMVVLNQTNTVFLLTLEDEYFIVYILKGGRITVLSTQSTKYDKFNMRLELSLDRNFSVTFDGLPIISFEENSHCFMCVKEQCKQPHHPFSEQHKNSKMNLDSFTNKLENQVFSLLNGYTGNLRLLITPIPNTETATENPPEEMEEAEAEEEDKEGQGDTQAGMTIKSREINMEVLRKTLTCPYCLMYMTATIHSCNVGHSFCAKCKTRLEKCPLCMTPLGDSRNFILEELAAQVALPCAYDEKGCTFVGKSPVMRKHEEECPFQD